MDRGERESTGTRNLSSENSPPVVVTQVDHCDRYDREQVGSFSLSACSLSLSLSFSFFISRNTLCSLFESVFVQREVSSARTTFEHRRLLWRDNPDERAKRSPHRPRWRPLDKLDSRKTRWWRGNVTAEGEGIAYRLILLWSCCCYHDFHNFLEFSHFLIFSKLIFVERNEDRRCNWPQVYVLCTI